MSTLKPYIPILKTRASELSALTLLKPDVHSAMTPLLELTPIPLEFPEEGNGPPFPGKNIDDHVAWILEKICNSSPRSLMVDGYNLDDQQVSDGREVIEIVLEHLQKASFTPIPVFGSSRNGGYLDAVNEFVNSTHSDACLRLNSHEIGPGLGEYTANAIGVVDLPPQRVHLLIDIGPLPAPFLEIMKVPILNIFQELPSQSEWKSVSIAATGYPPALSVSSYQMEIIQRTEWKLWNSILKNAKHLTRVPGFSDYAGCFPEVQDFDPRKMATAPKIKYTVNEEWLVAKGQAPKKTRQLKKGESNTPGSEQFPELAKMIINHSEWKGPYFSAGDKQIDNYSNGIGPFDVMTSVEAGFVHHMTFVVRQLAKISEK